MIRQIRRRMRNGLTLTELLVVVSIIVLVTGVMVPLMKPVFEGQETREAARNISVFFASAKTRAIQKNRPVGVWIERASSQLLDPTFPVSDQDANNPNNNIPPEKVFASYRMFIAEQPEPYTGDTQDAQMSLRMDDYDSLTKTLALTNRNQIVEYDFHEPPNGITPNETFRLGSFFKPPFIKDINQNNSLALSAAADGQDLVPVFGFAKAVTSGGALRLVRAGDYIQFDGRGGWYRIARHASAWPNENNPFAVVFVMYVPYRDATVLVPKFADGASYKILRQPRRSSAQPLELPPGVAIDLSLSGLGNVRHFRYPNVDAWRQKDMFGRGTIGVDENGNGEITPAERYYNSDLESAIPNESDIVAGLNYEIALMFNSDGTFDHVYYIDRRIHEGIYRVPTLGGVDPTFWTESIKRTTFDAAYLMIGLDEKVGRDRNNQPNVFRQDGNLADNLGEANLLDTTNIWLMVKHEQIATAQNAAIPSIYTDPSDNRHNLSPAMNLPPSNEVPMTYFARALRESRQLIQTGQNLGGR